MSHSPDNDSAKPDALIADRPFTDTSDKKPQKTRKLWRFSISTIQIILAIAAVFLLNLVTCSHSVTVDLSKSQKFSLSSRSYKFLRSETFSKREAPIKITTILNNQSPHRQRIRMRLEEYQRNANCPIDIEFISPYLDNNRLLEFSTQYQRKIHEDCIIIDASQPSTPSAERNKFIRQFPITSLYNTSSDGKEIDSWLDEDVITTYLLSAVEGNPRNFYFLVDKSEVDQEGNGTAAWRQFNANLQNQNVQLKPYQISSRQPVPADADGLAIIGLQDDLDEEEIALLSEYWDRNSASIFITLDPTQKLPRFRRFLRTYGMDVEDDRVITTKNGRTFANARAIFTRGSGLTTGFGSKSTRLEGPSCSITLDDSQNLASKNIQVFPVLQAAPGWWGEVNYLGEKPEFNHGKDHGTPEDNVVQTPLCLACAVVRGRQDLDTTKHLTSKLILITNSRFLQPENMRDELNHFIDSSINWLVGREELIGIGAKKAYKQKITLNADEKRHIDATVIIAMPLCALFVAFILWRDRRS